MSSIKTFQAAYQAAAGDKAKRDVVLKAIDDGLIHYGMTREQVVELFGGQLSDLGADSGRVLFAPPPKIEVPPGDLVPKIGLGGWAVMFSYSPVDHRVYSYELTCPPIGAYASPVFRAKEQVSMDEARIFRAAYQAAVDDRAKRDVVIKAIDDGIFFLRMSRDDIKRLFGDALVMDQGLDEHFASGYILFDKPRGEFRPAANEVSGAPPASPPLVKGWYIRFWFMPGEDIVESYVLSDIPAHKFAPAD